MTPLPCQSSLVGPEMMGVLVFAKPALFDSEGFGGAREEVVHGVQV